MVATNWPIGNLIDAQSSPAPLTKRGIMVCKICLSPRSINCGIWTSREDEDVLDLNSGCEAAPIGNLPGHAIFQLEPTFFYR